MLLLALAILILSTAFAVFLILPMRVPRKPGREGPDETADNVQGYDRLSRGLLFRITRHMALSRLKKQPAEGIVVDAGCGPGYLTIAMSKSFPGMKIIGLDISRLMMETAAHNISACPSGHCITLCRGDIQRLPFRDCSVDCIISTGSLHHWGDANRALIELHRVLRPGARLLIFDMRRDMLRFLYYGLWVYERFIVPAGVRRARGPTGSFWASYTPAEIGQMIAASGFMRWNIETRAGWMFVHAAKGGNSQD